MVLLFFSTILISLVEKVCLFLLLVVLLMRFAVSIYMFLSLVLVTFFMVTGTMVKIFGVHSFFL